MGLRGSNGEKERGQLKFCCDFRYLNAVTIKDAYPIPRIDESSLSLVMPSSSPHWTWVLPSGRSLCGRRIESKPDSRANWDCTSGRGCPFGLCNATATFQRLMAQALTRVTKKYGNLVMCYVDDVVIATPTLEDHIDRLDEVFVCMKRAGLKCKPSKCEILRDSIKYLGRMVGQTWCEAGPGSSRSSVDMESSQNGHTAPELPRICQLLPGVHKRICGQGVSDAEADAQ